MLSTINQKFFSSQDAGGEGEEVKNSIDKFLDEQESFIKVGKDDVTADGSVVEIIHDSILIEKIDDLHVALG